MPAGFLDAFAHQIPSKVIFRMKDARSVEGFFDHERKKLFGLQPLFRQTCLKPLELVLFTYQNDGVFDISVFGGDCTEKRRMNDPSDLGIENWK